VAVENVVAEDHRARLAFKKLLAQNERLSQAIRARLLDKAEAQSPL